MKILDILLLILLQERQILAESTINNQRNKGRLTVKSKKCVFPFIYRGVTYNDCAPGSDRCPYSWCATHVTSQVKVEDWDVCAPDTAHGNSYHGDQTDPLLCEYTDDRFCEEGIVKQNCRNRCRKDDNICKSLDRDDCQNKEIMKLCPRMCSAGKYADKCRQQNVRDNCPWLCQAEDDEICASLDQDDCKKERIKKLCPQLCSSDPYWCGFLDPIRHCSSKNITDNCKHLCDREEVEKMCIKLSQNDCVEKQIQDNCPKLCRAECPRGAFKCGWKCLDKQYRCDGHEDCEGGEDEEGCKCVGADMYHVSGQCFQVFKDKDHTWEEAGRFCHSKGLALAQPSEKNAVALRKLLLDKYGNSLNNVWVNAKGDGSKFVWQRDNAELRSDSPLLHPDRFLHPDSDVCLGMWVNSAAWNYHPSRPYRWDPCAFERKALCEVVSA